VCRALTGGLFAALSGQRQVAVCTVLLEVGSNGVISVSGLLKCFIGSCGDPGVSNPVHELYCLTS